MLRLYRVLMNLPGEGGADTSYFPYFMMAHKDYLVIS